MTESEPMRGRPRDPQTQRDIMAATRRLLSSEGYDGVSIDGIAREAGVSRPTVYRRWPSKAHVVFDAVFGDPEEADFVAPSGDFEVDLRRFIGGVLDFWREPVVEAAALGILAERHRDPDLHIRTQQLLTERTFTAFAGLAASGIEQGILRPDLEVQELCEMLIGTTFYAVQVQYRTDSADFDDLANKLCSLVLRGAMKKGTT